MSETIVALATPTGRSGIGVIRLSGGDALEYVRKLCAEPELDLPPRHATLKGLVDPDSQQVIDEAIVTFFKGPHSFTGEDVIEISCHGSPVLLRLVIDACLQFGARLAEAGEFTLRALGSGRIDLTEAEAIRDLIDAQTTASARQAVRQMRGEFSERLQPFKDELLNIIVVLESALEFVEDDLPEAQTEKIRESLTDLTADIEILAATFRSGHLIREGLRVAIVGRPNVGKSSLFNALLGSERAIVTDIAGTTRDHLDAVFMIGDIPVSLIDTAGLRQTDDVVESIGVERSKAQMADADLVIVILDASDEISREDHEIIESVAGLTYIVALNKVDKEPSYDIDHLIAAEHSALAYLREKLIPISAKTGEGLDDLRQSIVTPFSADDPTAGGFLVTDARHYDLLKRTATEIASSVDSLDAGMSEEIILVGLHNALRYLGEITGETTTEDVLTRIFSTFCIGK